MQPRSVQCAPIVAPSITTALSIVRALADGDAALEHGAAADPRARADPAAGLDQRRRDDPPVALDAVVDAEVAPSPMPLATSVATVPSRMSNVACR